MSVSWISFPSVTEITLFANAMFTAAPIPCAIVILIQNTTYRNFLISNIYCCDRKTPADNNASISSKSLAPSTVLQKTTTILWWIWLKMHIYQLLCLLNRFIQVVFEESSSESFHSIVKWTLNFHFFQKLINICIYCDQKSGSATQTETANSEFD